jgi:hypothetical protein
MPVPEATASEFLIPEKQRGRISIIHFPDYEDLTPLLLLHLRCLGYLRTNISRAMALSMANSEKPTRKM